MAINLHRVLAAERAALSRRREIGARRCTNTILRAQVCIEDLLSLAGLVGCTQFKHIAEHNSPIVVCMHRNVMLCARQGVHNLCQGRQKNRRRTAGTTKTPDIHPGCGECATRNNMTAASHCHPRRSTDRLTKRSQPSQPRRLLSVWCG